MTLWQNEDNLKNENDLKNEDDRKNEDDIFMQRRLYIEEAHTVLNIFPTAPPIRPLSY